MSDFLKRMVAKARAELPLVRPVLGPRFGPEPSLLEETPERALQYAVKGMLPRGPLGRRMLSKLRVFAGAEHNHAAQQPMPLEVNA